jgi:hypothetical protein
MALLDSMAIKPLTMPEIGCLIPSITWFTLTNKPFLGARQA